jgi:hypothetical protein
MARRKIPAKKSASSAQQNLNACLNISFLTLLLVVIVVCYWPLTQYFFAQDDFSLLAEAAFNSPDGVTKFFDDQPGQFRPITKGLYFIILYRLFDLNPFPYHLISLFLHLFNVIMTYRLLKKLGVGNAAALTGSTLFGLSAAFFHVIAWISCIQQLMGLAFALICLEYGIRAMEKPSARNRWISLAAYAAALGSFEQTAMLPVTLLLIALLRWSSANTIAPRRALSATIMHWALFFLYILFMVGWKGLRDTGSYELDFGTNILLNFAAYLGWSFQYFRKIAIILVMDSYVFQWTHILVLALVAYHLLRRRFLSVVFGLGFFTALIFPTLLLSSHRYYLHTYVPSFGTIYLMALLVDDLLAVRLMRFIRLRYAIVASIVIFVTVMAYKTIRLNETYKHPVGNLKSSFVIRRAEISRKIYDAISTHRRNNPEIIYLIYAKPNAGELFVLSKEHIMTALGHEAGFRLFYDSPDLKIAFVPLEATAGLDAINADVFYYDDLGHCYTLDEMKARFRR